MANVTVVGAQWGDEGKGKIVDWLCDRADVVVRFQGGHNAGHTLVVGGQVYKLSLLPSGVVQGKLSVIGNGVVVDPWALLDEIENLAGQGVAISPEPAPGRQRLPDPAAAPRPRPAARRPRRSKIGTTGRGIGPAYEDKVGRRAIRVADLADRAALEAKIDRLLAHHDALRAGLGPGRSTAPRSPLGCSRSRRRSCPSPSRRGAARREAREGRDPLRGRAGLRCSTSTTAPIRT